MIVVGGRKFANLTQTQVDQIAQRSLVEKHAVIGKQIGLDARTVSDVAHLLGIKNTRKLKLRPFEALYNILVAEVRRRPSRFSRVELSYDEFLVFTTIKVCHYCGEPLQWAERINRNKMPYTGYNLDRKDSSLGYTKENCVACCGFCNYTKGDRFTYKEFKLIASTIRHVLRVRKIKAMEV